MSVIVIAMRSFRSFGSHWNERSTIAPLQCVHKIDDRTHEIGGALSHGHCDLEPMTDVIPPQDVPCFPSGITDPALSSSTGR